jgi:hypothetical protein
MEFRRNFLCKDLEVAYNDLLRYRAANRLRTLEQAIQVRDYNNKIYLPPNADQLSRSTEL